MSRYLNLLFCQKAWPKATISYEEAKSTAIWGIPNAKATPARVGARDTHAGTFLTLVRSDGEMLVPGLALIVWVLVFAAALVGLAVGARLPDRHRTDESRSVVSVSMAMVGTLTALVLGLLLSNASISFRTRNSYSR